MKHSFHTYKGYCFPIDLKYIKVICSICNKSYMEDDFFKIISEHKEENGSLAYYNKEYKKIFCSAKCGLIFHEQTVKGNKNFNLS